MDPAWVAEVERRAIGEAALKDAPVMQKKAG
jgi:hypothetical protein